MSKSKAPKAEAIKRVKTWRPHRKKQLVAAAILVILCGAAGYVGGSWSGKGQADDTLSRQRQIVFSGSELISYLAKQASPSVVSVGVISQSAQNSFFGSSQPTTQQSAGTGIILNEDGLIITNRHVVPEGTTEVSVTLSDGTKFDKVDVVGRTAQSSSLDVAFLKITGMNGRHLKLAKLGNSSKMKVGDKVIAIGNALGQFQNTVTSGIISGYNRSLIASDESGQNSERLQDLFQTDAAINQGNSGGPLVNMQGEVIAINTAVAGQAENIGFAIPINNVKGLIESVRITGELKQPYLGVFYVSLTPDYAYLYNLPIDHGAYIVPSSQSGQPAIIAGSPAERAGLKENDIIIKVNHQNVGQNSSLSALLGRQQVGDQVSLTLRRGDKIITVQVTLEALPG